MGYSIKYIWVYLSKLDFEKPIKIPNYPPPVQRKKIYTLVESFPTPNNCVQSSSFFWTVSLIVENQLNLTKCRLNRSVAICVHFPLQNSFLCFLATTAATTLFGWSYSNGRPIFKSERIKRSGTEFGVVTKTCVLEPLMFTWWGAKIFATLEVPSIT